MDLREYQAFTPTTWVPGITMEIDLAHATNGLFAEAGEVAGVYQKFYRGDYGEDELKGRLVKELGGLMYYICMVCNLEDLDLSIIIAQNKAILEGRKARGVIQGDGDNR